MDNGLPIDARPATAADWADAAELDRWRRAVQEAAERVERDRGVVEPWLVFVEGGSLWFGYGAFWMRVEDVAGPEKVFDEVDSWVAFERPAGPGRVLDRDREAMQAWRDRLPGLVAFWEGIARRVVRDVEATTTLDHRRRVAVEEDELVMPTSPGVVLSFGETTWPRRELPFPQVMFWTATTGSGLPALADEDDAVAFLADRVQEHVIEELHGAWPPCPRHAHPLELATDQEGRTVWRCSADPGTAWVVGSLR